MNTTSAHEAINKASWNRLDHVAHTSKNRKILSAVLHAENACNTDGPSHHITDNRIIDTIVHRAITNNWDDVLVSATSSRHMTRRNYANIISADRIFSEDVYAGILDSPAAASPALMSMVQNRTPYPAIREGAREVRLGIVHSTIRAAIADPEKYTLDADDEHPEVAAAVTIALALDRHDLLDKLVVTGCTGSFTAQYRLAA